MTGSWTNKGDNLFLSQWIQWINQNKINNNFILKRQNNSTKERKKKQNKNNLGLLVNSIQNDITNFFHYFAY